MKVKVGLWAGRGFGISTIVGYLMTNPVHSSYAKL